MDRRIRSQFPRLITALVLVASSAFPAVAGVARQCDPTPLVAFPAPVPGSGPAAVLGAATFIAGANTVTAFDSDTGGQLWHQSTLPAAVIGAPVAAMLQGGQSAVFVTLNDGSVARIDASNGDVDWIRVLRRPTCPQDQVAATPAVQLRQLSNPIFQMAVFDDLVMVATNYTCPPQNQNRIVALQASTGAPQWIFNEPQMFPLDFATAGCTVDYERNLIYCGTNQTGPTQPSLWAIGTTNGGLQWAQPMGSIHTRPQLAGLHLFVANDDPALLAVQAASGAPEWQIPLPSPVTADFLAGSSLPETRLLLADQNGFLHGVTDHGPSGTLDWSNDFGVGVSAAPAAWPDFGRIYAGLQDGRVAEVDRETGALLAERVAGPAGAVYSTLVPDASGPGDHDLTTVAGTEGKRFCTPFLPAIMSRAEAIDLVLTEVIQPSPLESLMVAFLLKRTEPDSLFLPGQSITDFDSTFTMNVAAESYLFWLDLDPEAFWTHPSQFILVNARSGQMQFQDSNSWPVIDGVQQNHLTFDGNSSPNRFHGSYAPGPVNYSFTPVDRPPSNQWAIVVTGMNLKKDAVPDAPAIEGDATRVKEILNGVDKGPKIPCDNITTVNTGTGGNTGATNEEICAAFDNLPKDCEKLWVSFVGHGSGDGSGHFVTRGPDGKPGKLPWSEVRKKILETGAKEVCIILMCCFSGDAIDDLEAALQEGGTGPKIRIKGSIITSSSATRPTDREADGSTWMKALLECWKDCNADLDDDMKITMFEAQAWARANSTKAAGRDPKGKTLGGDTVTFPPSHTTTETSSADGGGSLKFEMTFVYYKIGNTLTCRATLYVNNTSGSPRRALRSVRVICKDKRGRTIGEPMVLTPAQLSLGAKQRRCIGKLPPGCSSIKIEKVENLAGNEALPLAPGGEDSRVVLLYEAVPYRPGELVFETFQVVGEPGNVFEGSTTPAPGWNPLVYPEYPFTLESWLDTLDVILTAEVPAFPTEGALLQVLMDNTTTGDSVCFQVNAMLFDSTGLALGAGQTHVRKHIEAYGGLAVSGGTAELHDSILEIAGSPDCTVAPDGRLVMANTTVLPDSGIAYTFDVEGGLDWSNSTLVEPAGGLRLESAAARIRDGGVLSSGDVGLLVSGPQDSLDLDFFLVSGSAGDGVVLDGATDLLLRNLSVEESGGEDLVLRNASSVECRDCRFDENKLSVESGSALVRSWSTNFVLFTADGDSIPGVTLTVVDALGDTVAVAETDEFGFSPLLSLVQETWDGSAATDRTPHSVMISVGGVDTTVVYVAARDSTLKIDLGVETSSIPGLSLPMLSLAQNQPNPFRHETTIRFVLGERCPIKLELFDMSGRLVRTLVGTEMSRGTHSYVLDARGLPAGVYFYRIEAGGESRTDKLVVVN